MKVEIDAGSGFCFGVVRAIRMAEDALARWGRVWSLGDIVHNRLEVERLEELGLGVVGLDDVKRGMAVLVRAHGEPPGTYERVHGIGVEVVVDATCPVVAALQGTVRRAWEAMTGCGGQVVILGKRGHAEVVGLTGQICGESLFCTTKGSGRYGFDARPVSPERPVQVGGGAPVFVVEGVGDLDIIDFGRPIYFLSQTTQSLGLFGLVSEELRRRGGDVTVHDTICRAVAGREQKLGEFAARHGAVVFVSGRKSSNGRLLFEACRAANGRSYMVEDEGDLREEWFEGVESVGVCGATSTPAWIMERVARALEGM